MSAEVANPAKGVLFQNGTPYASPVYATIGLVTSLDGPSREVGTRETTIITSTTKTFAPTLTDNGEVSGEVLFDPKGTTHAHMDALIGTPVLEKWKITFADTAATVYAFDGVLTEWAPKGMAVEENLMASFKVKVSGAITIT